jgi:hypothetical protein
MWEGKLHVSVDDDVWLENLSTLAAQIVAQVNKVAGGEVVREIRFRVGVPKRPPVRAAEPIPAAVADDPDGIRDPVLGRIYQASKKRAHA